MSPHPDSAQDPISKDNGLPDRHASAFDKLAEVEQMLSYATNLDSVTAIVREAARHIINADGATFVLRDGEMCYYADESAIRPLWKGQRFSMGMCISGWAMRNAKSVVIEDIYLDSRIPAIAYRPTFVKSLAMVPMPENEPIGAIGNYWANRYVPTPEEMDILQALANIAGRALIRLNLVKR